MSDRPFRDAMCALQQRTYGAKQMLTGLRPSVREWLGVCILDSLGWDPADLCDGVSVCVTQDLDASQAVVDGLRLLYRRVLNQGSSVDGDHDGGLTIIDAPDSPERYDDAVNIGAPVVIVCSQTSQVRPHAAVVHPKILRTLDVPLMSDVVEDLIEVVTGSWVAVSDDLASRLPVGEVLRCVHHGSTADACLDRIKKTVASYDEEDGVEPKLKAPPPPVATGDVVRRLSEMSGFGEAAVWGLQLAADLRDYAAGRLPWRDVDRGMLLSGPPGCGKTTFARALALECGVDLVTTTYGDWGAAGGTTGDSMTRGMGRLFDTWRKKADKGPFVLFVDEIDSMGQRGGAAHNESWFAPIINGWLAFLDGAVSRDGIVVLAATNYADRVDPAMLRPGRLDRHVELPMPDVSALIGVVRAHLGDDAVLPADDLAEAARAVRGRSPAEVAILCRDARRIARWCKRRVCASDLTEVVAMRRKDERPADARLVAVHEAAHAVAAVLLDVDELTCVDVDAGRTSFLTRSYATEARLEDRLTMILSARAAEEVMLGAPTNGAAQDLQDATVVATAMHAGWGYGASGLVHVPVEIAARDSGIATAVRGTLDAAYARALALVAGHRDVIERVAQALLRSRYLDAAEVRALVFGAPPAPSPRPTGRAPGTGLRRLRAVAGP